MRKFFVRPLLASVVVCGGCTNLNTEDLSVKVTDSEIHFSADNADSRTYEDTEGNMLWSDYDNIAVYSVSDAGVVSDFCSINAESVNTSRAKFTPAEKRSVSEWFGNEQSVTFLAYYPLSTSSDDEEDGTSNADTVAPAQFDNGKVLLSLPELQSGDFGRHHVCYVAKENVDVSECTGTISFGDFKTATSIIRVRLKLASDCAYDEIDMKRLLIKSNTQLTGSYKLNLYDGSITIVDDVRSDNFYTCAVNFATSQTITKNDYVYVDFVVLPTSEAVELSFEAYCDSATEAIEFVKETGTIAGGIVAGKRYNFSREVTVKDYEAQYATYGYANCLMLDAGQNEGVLDITPYITTNKTNITKSESAIETTAAKAVAVGILWSEPDLTIGSMSISSEGLYDKLTISGVEGYGNAVVAIYDDQKNILWSYHIWKTQIDSMADSLIECGDGSMIMPLALGATAVAQSANDQAGVGLYYQWGRKDPLGRKKVGSTNYYSDSNIWLNDVIKRREIDELNLDPEISLDRHVLSWTVAHPTTFIQVTTGTDTAGNWASLNNIYLWNTTKTIYDPCPEGYQVAPTTAYASMTYNNNYNFSYNSEDTGIIVPSGRRQRTNGSIIASLMVSATSGGFYWSANAIERNTKLNTSFSYVLKFNDTRVQLQDTWDRAEGMAVRCVRTPNAN